MGAGDLIDRGSQFYRLHLTAVLKIVTLNLAAGLVATAVETLAVWLYPNGSTVATIASVVASVVAIAVGVIAFTMLVRLVTNGIKGPTTTKTGFQASLERFWPTTFGVVGSGVLIFLGLVAFILPGVVFWTWFAFVPVVAALADASGWRIFSLSRELVAGRFLAILWRLAVPLCFFSLLQLVLVLIAILVLQGGIRGIWSIELMVSGAPLWFLLFVNGTTETVRQLLSPLFTIALTILYLTIKEKGVAHPTN